MSALVEEKKIKYLGEKGIPHAKAEQNIPFRGSWATHRPSFDYPKCIKCHLCWIICPDTAIKIRKNGTTESDALLCKGCGLCAAICPTKCISMKKVKK